MRNVSARAMRAMMAQETDEVFLFCITITHSSFAAPYYLVNDQVQLVRAAATFVPCAFSISLPNEQEDQLPQLQWSIDNIDRSILQSIRAIPSGKPTVKMEVVLASTPDVVEAGPFVFSGLSVDYDSGTINGTIGFEDDVLNNAYPGDSYTPTNSPGLFI